MQSLLLHFKALLCIQRLHKALSWWQLEFVGWGQGGRDRGRPGGLVEIAKLWEPRQCAEDEGEGKVGKGGGEGLRAGGTMA